MSHYRQRRVEILGPERKRRPRVTAVLNARAKQRRKQLRAARAARQPQAPKHAALRLQRALHGFRRAA